VLELTDIWITTTALFK